MSKNKKISRKRLIKLTMAQRKDRGPRDIKDEARELIEIEREVQRYEKSDPRVGRLCWRDML